jgi:hypothetical protein
MAENGVKIGSRARLLTLCLLQVLNIKLIFFALFK